MRYSYDASVDALYVTLLDAAPARQMTLTDGVVADLADSGALVGVEVLGARTAGWDPRELREQGLAVDDYELAVLLTLTARLGMLRLAVATDEIQPAYTNDELALAAG